LRTHDRLLPPKSPFRKGLISLLGEGMSKEELHKAFQIDDKTARSISLKSRDAILSVRGKTGVRRERISKEVLEVSLDVMNTILPTLSGRSYRVTTMTDSGLYQWYVKE